MVMMVMMMMMMMEVKVKALKPQIFFWAFLLLHNCENHFHFFSLSAVHLYDLYQCTSSIIIQLLFMPLAV